MPPGARRRLAHPRLLRLGQPQRQGDLPALPRLVRRQPGPPVAAPAGGRGDPLRRGRSAASTRPSPRPRSSPTQGDLRFAAELASHAVFADPDARGRQGRCSPTVLSGSASARRTRPGATATSPAPRSCAAARSQPTPIGVGRDGPGADRSPSCSTPSPSASTGRRAWERLAQIRWQLTDSGEEYRMELSNGAWSTTRPPGPSAADLTVSLSRRQLLGPSPGGQHRRPPGGG